MRPFLSLMAMAAVCATSAAGCAQHVSAQSDQTIVSMTRGNEKLRITLKGRIERLSDDGRDIAAMTAGSELSITQGGWLRSIFIGGDTLVLRGLADGTIEREYFTSGRRQPFEPDGVARLAALMPQLIASGMATDARIDQLLRTAGPQGVLDEIVQLESDYVEARFLRRLLIDMDPSPVSMSDALTLAGKEIGSDYELARLLRGVSDRAMADAAAREAFFTATSGIASDYELQRVLAPIVSNEAMPAEAVSGALAAGMTIDSDYEASRLVQAVAKRPLPDPAPAALFKLVRTIASDYEQRRALDAVLGRADLSDAMLSEVLDVALGIGSDYELARLLTRVASARTLSDPLRQKYLAAAETIGSDYEQNRALAALVRRSGA